jgi:FtsH-binding integral membrane protein
MAGKLSSIPKFWDGLITEYQHNLSRLVGSRKPWPLASTRDNPANIDGQRDKCGKMIEKNKFNQNLLRTMALTILLVGSIGSLYFMFNAGSNQKSIVLLGLFTAWVLSPFVGLFVANRIFTHWAVTTRQLIYWLMVALTIVSLIAYSGALTPSNTKPAFIFLVIPFLSWLVILTALLVAKRLSRKDTNQ